MMSYVLIGCVMWSVNSIMPQDVTLPDVARPGVAGYVSGELIYSLHNRPTPSCHASTIAETPEGLVAAWFAGTDEKDPDVTIRVARFEDGHWSKSHMVVDGSEGEDKAYACWNPILFQPKDGPLLLFYKVGPSPDTWWGMLTTSADHGRTWATPHRLGDDPAIGHLLGPVKNKPIQLSDGSILCPSSSEHDGWRVHFEVTRDLGKTWKVIGPINDGKEFSAIQPSILTYPDGRMQILCRSRQNVLTTSWSDDNGKTWSKLTGTTIPNPNAGTDAVTLSDGRQLLVYNHTTRATGNRGILNVAISSDGTDWRPVLTLENAKGEFSYPAVIQTRDGMVQITYTYQRKTVKHVVLDPAKIIE
jgi:predicted neuraminidase